MNFVASKLKNSRPGGRYPCTPPGVNPQDPHFGSTPPPPPLPNS